MIAALLENNGYRQRFFRDIFIFYVATIVFFAVGVITTLGLGWYRELVTPWWTPPELVVALIWGILFLTTVFSLSMFCDKQEVAANASRTTVLLYMGNALLILLWNYLFFGIHQLELALAAAIAVGVSVLILSLRVAGTSKIAAWLLAPYLLWMILAISINYGVMILN